MSRLSRHLLPALLLAFPLAVLPAQQPALVGEPAATAELPAPAPQATPDAAAPGGPRLAQARAGVDIAPAPIADDALLQDNPTTRRGVRHMIVGGAIIIVGGLIGDDAGTVVSIGGAALLLYGVYLYLQGS